MGYEKGAQVEMPGMVDDDGERGAVEDADDGPMLSIARSEFTSLMLTKSSPAR